MKLLIDETVGHPSTNFLFTWGQVRRFVWETGQEDQPYLAVAVSTVVNAFDDQSNVLDSRDERANAVYAWAEYQTTSFYSSLSGAQEAAPTVYDITSTISREFSTEAEAAADAVAHLGALRSEDFKPETIV